MDEPEEKRGWLFYALLIAFVVVVVIAALLWIGPQIANIFRYGPDNL